MQPPFLQLILGTLVDHMLSNIILDIIFHLFVIVEEDQNFISSLFNIIRL